MGVDEEHVLGGFALVEFEGADRVETDASEGRGQSNQEYEDNDGMDFDHCCTKDYN